MRLKIVNNKANSRMGFSFLRNSSTRPRSYWRWLEPNISLFQPTLKIEESHISINFFSAIYLTKYKHVFQLQLYLGVSCTLSRSYKIEASPLKQKFSPFAKFTFMHIVSSGSFLNGMGDYLLILQTVQINSQFKHVCVFVHYN